MTSAAAEPRHLPVLDGLRGVAILLVAVFHCAVIDTEAPADALYTFVASCGFAGVDLFFVLSDYLITGILLDAPRTRRALGSFYARRALRTLPLYYAVLAASLLALPHVLPADKAARFASITADRVYYVLHLSNVAIARAHQFRHPVLDVSWSLAIEEQFYLVWPLVALASARRTLLRVTLGMIAAALLLRVALVFGLHADAYATYVLTPCRMDALAVGALLAALARAPGGLARWRPAAAWIAPLAAAVAVATVRFEMPARGGVVLPGSGWPLATFGFTAIAAAFGALLVLAVTAPPGGLLTRALSTRLLRAFGEVSYGIYLVHLPVRAVIRDHLFGPGWSAARWKFPVVGGAEVLGQLAFNLLAVAAAFALAWLSYHLFEARFLALKRRFPLK